VVLLLNPYLDAILALGLALIATVLILAIFNSLSGLPVIGGKLVQLGHKVAQTIASACGAIASGVTAAVGVSLHAIGARLNATWRMMGEATAVLAHVARVVADHVYSLTGLRALVHRVTRIAHLTSATVRVVERRVHGIEHGLKTFERDISKGIGEDVLPRLRHEEKELTKLRHKVIPRLRAIAEGAEADAQAALGKIGAIPFPTGVKTWAEAIAAGLTALGLGWLRCDANPFHRNPAACGLWGDLADILALVVATELALDFEQAVHDAQAVAAVTVEAFYAAFGLSN
jgi:hypothetical protein